MPLPQFVSLVQRHGPASSLGRAPLQPARSSDESAHERLCADSADDESATETRSTASGGYPSASSAGSDQLLSGQNVSLSDDDQGSWVAATRFECSMATPATVQATTAASSAQSSRRSLLQLIAAEAEVLLPPLETYGVPVAQRELEECYVARSTVRRQLLADACRGRYVIDDQELWLEKESSSSSDSTDEAPTPSASTAFAERLVRAVERCVGHESGAPDGLPYVAMLLLTQIGFALAHAASAGPQLALCGGRRRVSYELKRITDVRWHLRGEFCAHGFSLYQVSGSSEPSVGLPCPGSGGRDEGFATTKTPLVDAGPSACSTASSVHRGFTVGLALCSSAPRGLVVDVQDVFEELVIFSTDGMPATIAPSAIDASGFRAAAIASRWPTFVEEAVRQRGAHVGGAGWLKWSCAGARCGTDPPESELLVERV